MYKCARCDGDLYYSIEEKKVICKSCGSKFEPSRIDSKELISEDKYEINVFSCTQCCGQILSDDEQAVAVCPYCGSQIALSKSTMETKRPEYVLPFQISEKECHKQYRKQTEGIPFLPDEYINPKNLTSFIGIYMPYWLYSFKFEGDLSFDGFEQYNKKIPDKHGNKVKYVIKDYGTFTYHHRHHYENVPRDASSTFDDGISEALQPFDKDKIKTFAPGYLCGFYADYPTVDKSEYEDVVEAQAVEDYIARSSYVSGFHLSDTDIRNEFEKQKDKVKYNTALGPFSYLVYDSSQE